MKTWFPDASQERIAVLTVEFEAEIVNSGRFYSRMNLVAAPDLKASLSDARALEAEGKTGLIILPSVQRILAEIRNEPQAEEHYAICTSGEPVKQPAHSSIAYYVFPSPC